MPAHFLAAWAGDDDDRGLNEAETFAEQLAQRKEPSDKQLSLLSKARLKRTPTWRISCLMALLAAPEQFCQDGQATMFTEHDTKNMETRLLPHIEDAIAMIQTARAWLGKPN